MSDADRTEGPRAPGPRERLVRSALELVGRQGTSGTGLRAVVERAAAPRGSLQHYFPGGKHQLVAEALGLAGRTGARSARRASSARPDGVPARPSDVLVAMTGAWRRWLAESDYATGCPVMATVVDVADAHPDLRSAALEAWSEWEAAVVDQLTSAGVPPDRASTLARVTLASLEGAILASRLRHSLVPLDDLQAELGPLLDAARR